MNNRRAGQLAWVSVMAAVLLPMAGCRKAGPEKEAEGKTVEKPEADPSTAAPAPGTDEKAASTASPPPGDLNKVGKILFQTSCDPKVQSDFERGAALLHSFFYNEARSVFEEVTKQDPNCAIGFWGIAMTHYHPLWAPPNPEEMAAGIKAVEQAKQATNKSEREQALIDTVASFYLAAEPAAEPPAKGKAKAKAKAADKAVGQSCHGPTGGHPGRAKAYTAALEKAHQQFPEEEEIAAFYALSLLGSATPGDLELKNQKQAAAVLEKLWAKRKDHPGVAHYLIHAYDFPPLAESGLPAAKEYASIAPRVPHALHMPSHIFIRLGMWQEAIDSNLASADAAHAYTAQKVPDATSFEELHAQDYLVYSYLQTGQEAKAEELVKRTATVKKTFPAQDFAAAYAIAAIPARFAVERHAWKEAAALTVPELEFWAKFPFTEAHIEYARGLGSARSGDVEGAKKALARLAQLREATTDPKFAYFKSHLELQHKAVAAWVTNAEGKKDEAIKQLSQAAEMEDKLGKHPVSPGPVYPIREQLGEMLLELERPADALVAFQASLKISPHRFHGIYGAARAAQMAKKDDEARKYYTELLAVASAADSENAQLAQAREFLGGSKGGLAQ